MAGRRAIASECRLQCGWVWVDSRDSLGPPWATLTRLIQGDRLAIRHRVNRGPSDRPTPSYLLSPSDTRRANTTRYRRSKALKLTGDAPELRVPSRRSKRYDLLTHACQRTHYQTADCNLNSRKPPRNTHPPRIRTLSRSTMPRFGAEAGLPSNRYAGAMQACHLGSLPIAIHRCTDPDGPPIEQRFDISHRSFFYVSAIAAC
jgi:hypothetical protein